MFRHLVNPEYRSQIRVVSRWQMYGCKLVYPWRVLSMTVSNHMYAKRKCALSQLNKVCTLGACRGRHIVDPYCE